MAGRTPLRPLRYLAGIDLGRRILWCYLVWYLVFVGLYFDPSPSIWLSALGVCALVGFAFLMGFEASPSRWRGLDRWMIARLFLIPFCVSSFSALAKGHRFIVIFSPVLAEDAVALAGCGVFFAACKIARRMVGHTVAAV